jgi:hypothetical protein
MNTEQVPKPSDADADPVQTWGKLPSRQEERAKRALPMESAGAWVTACWQEEPCGNTGSPLQRLGKQARQPVAREGRTGLDGMAERSVVLEKPGNAGGGKGPWFKSNARGRQKPGDWR